MTRDDSRVVLRVFTPASCSPVCDIPGVIRFKLKIPDLVARFRKVGCQLLDALLGGTQCFGTIPQSRRAIFLGISGNLT